MHYHLPSEETSHHQQSQDQHQIQNLAHAQHQSQIQGQTQAQIQNWRGYNITHGHDAGSLSPGWATGHLEIKIQVENDKTTRKQERKKKKAETEAKKQAAARELLDAENADNPVAANETPNDHASDYKTNTSTDTKPIKGDIPEPKSTPFADDDQGRTLQQASSSSSGPQRLVEDSLQRPHRTDYH